MAISRVIYSGRSTETKSYHFSNSLKNLTSPCRAAPTGVRQGKRCYISILPTATAARTRRFHSAGHRPDDTTRAACRYRGARRIFEELAPDGHPSGDQSTDVSHWKHTQCRASRANGEYIQSTPAFSR